MKLPRDSKAYSALEMLVTLSLILVMIAMLLPALQTVRDTANASKCVMNLRQIGVGMMVYASDRGHFPYACHFKQWGDWAEEIIPYMDTGTRWVTATDSWACGMKKDPVTGNLLAHETGQGIVLKANPKTVIRAGYNWFSCPAVKTQSNYGTPPWDGTTVHRYAHHYSCNEYLMPWGYWSSSPKTYANEAAAESAYNAGTYVRFPAVRPGELSRPGSLMLVCDAGNQVPDNEADDTLGSAVQAIMSDFDNNPDTASTRGTTPVTTAAAYDTDNGDGHGWPVYYRHRGRCNAVMADGHVQQFKNGELLRRNFCSRGRTKTWGVDYRFIEVFYP